MFYVLMYLFTYLFVCLLLVVGIFLISFPLVNEHTGNGAAVKMTVFCCFIVKHLFIWKTEFKGQVLNG